MVILGSWGNILQLCPLEVLLGACGSPFSVLHYCQANVCHVWIWDLDRKEGWVPKNWSFQIVILEKTLESPLDFKETKPVNPKGNQSSILIRRTDAEAEAPTLWPPDAKSQLIGKDPDAGKDWRQEEKGMTENEMVGWHCRFNGHEFEQAPGDGEGRGSLACCSPWGCRVRHDWATEQQQKSSHRFSPETS